MVVSTKMLALELPPRARRIPGSSNRMREAMGTTSACAENTGLPLSMRHTALNYLRVRGEYAPMATTTIPTGELPPRARRIQYKIFLYWPFPGTTSACAENTARIIHKP